ncbi:M15 family metallopeptidase [Gilvimarinus polysaccharolyticus]|uniref:M15 family metallopeptidase n=1 Tax=Gilvimarinus polysaccharolyticus TaxID=863921 RepID=UPI0006736118|nr:M15 family metallopeptidase [Gilvimarinus polysaccharolyticus]
MATTKANTALAALGLDESALLPLTDNLYLHCDVVEPYRALVSAARQQNIELTIASGYRSFARQLAIFNAKATGQRPVLNDAGETVAMHTLSDADKLWAILRFSALPGASRHHWGTDMDVFDRAAMAPDYQLQLTPDECCPGGVFDKLHCWLDAYLPECDFFRPYDVNSAAHHNGVAPEPWHLSYAPVAQRFAAWLTPDVLAQTIAASDIELKATVLSNITSIYERYVRL